MTVNISFPAVKLICYEYAVAIKIVLCRLLCCKYIYIRLNTTSKNIKVNYFVTLQ